MSLYGDLTIKQHTICLSVALIGPLCSLLSLPLITMCVIDDLILACIVCFAPTIIGGIGCYYTALYFTKRNKEVRSDGD